MDFSTLSALSLVISPKTGEEMSIASLAVPSGVFLYDALTVISGLFWTVAYILIIYYGFKHKTSGMPLLVLGLNISWEFIFAFLGAPLVPEGSLLDLTAQTGVQRVVNAIWFLFDCAILYLKFKYGRDEFKASMPHAPDWLFYPELLFILFCSVCAVMFSVNEWNDHNGVYAAYLQNIFISSLFIPMLYRKGSGAGQSMWIAITKCLGTIAPGAMGALVMIREYGCNWKIFVDFKFMPLMKFLIEACLIFDIVYMVCLYRMLKYHDHVDPWTRKPLPGYEWGDDPVVAVPISEATVEAPVAEAAPVAAAPAPAYTPAPAAAPVAPQPTPAPAYTPAPAAPAAEPINIAPAMPYAAAPVIEPATPVAEPITPVVNVAPVAPAPAPVAEPIAPVNVAPVAPTPAPNAAPVAPQPTYQPAYPTDFIQSAD